MNKGDAELILTRAGEILKRYDLNNPTLTPLRRGENLTCLVQSDGKRYVLRERRSDLPV